MSAIDDKQTGTSKWVVLTISFLLMFVFSISLQALPPIFGNIMKDIPFSHSQAGFLMSAYSFLGIFIPFLVAFFVNRFDLKKMLMVGLVAVIIGLLGFALSKSYSLLLIFRLVSGAGATIVAVLAPLLITMFFDQKDMGIAMGVFNTGVPLGIVVSANLFGYLGLFMDWKTIITGIAIIATTVLAMVLFLLVMPKNQERDDASTPQLDFNLGPSLWFLAIIWMIANGQLLVYTTFGPEFFQLSGITTQKAGFLTSMIVLVSIFLTPIVGIVIDKIDSKKLFLLLGSIIIGISYILIARSWLSLSFWAVALGIGFSVLPVCIFSLLPEVIESEQTGVGLALLTAGSNLGIAIGPAGFGTLLDITSGNFVVVFTALSMFSLISIFVIFGIRTKQGVN